MRPAGAGARLSLSALQCFSVFRAPAVAPRCPSNRQPVDPEAALKDIETARKGAGAARRRTLLRRLSALTSAAAPQRRPDQGAHSSPSPPILLKAFMYYHMPWRNVKAIPPGPLIVFCNL